MDTTKLFSTVLDADQLKRFKEFWKRKGKTDQELEPLLREYEDRVLADGQLTPEQRDQWNKESVIFMRDGLGLTEEEIQKYCPEVKEFGHSPENPIPVNDIDGEKEYLSSLWCTCGNPMVWVRAGSLLKKHYDIFKANCACQQRCTLYLDMYNSESSKDCPKSLKIIKNDTKGRRSSVEFFKTVIVDGQELEVAHVYPN